jgi:hypothetical protein
MVHIADTIEPNKKNHEIYKDMYDAYISAYEGLSRETFGKLSDLQAI